MNGPSYSASERVARRTVLRAGAAGAGVVLSGAAGAPWAGAAGASRTRVHVLVIDGCRPGEITPDLTPRLHALRRAGRWYPQARALPVMETIPNHTMMMAGVRPDRTQVPANAIYDRTAGVVRTLDRPDDLRFPTVLERLRRIGLTTGTVLSKEYLYGIFGTRATYRWEPAPLVPISDHAPDVFTQEALIAMVEDADPDLVFANFGDIDRFGHADLTGTTLQLARRLALLNTDRLIGEFVDFLRGTGRWRHSVLVVLADHSMDWSLPNRFVSLTPVFDADPLLAGRVAIADNGGADLLTWTGPATDRPAALRRMRRLAVQVEGVLSVRTPAQLRLSDRAGDLIVYCQAGWRFSDPEPVSNPIPGNHGHPATEPIPFFFSGGSPQLRAGVSTALATTVDVAPTVGALLGLGTPVGGYDGRSRL
ncbi:MAG: alkaline phosphatase family protein [Actinomycetota bacterium]|nr:alkaline phosphatase family protein [Actinomycetota bacterium]